MDYSKITTSCLRSMHRFFNEAARRANKRVGITEAEQNTNVVQNDGGYKCINLSENWFFEVMVGMMKAEALSDPYRLTFIDIGCGVGEKVFYADLLGFISRGLELRQPLIDEAKEIFKSFGLETRENRFIQGDALTYNFSRFDVLYFYCPLFKLELQQKLEEQIIKTAKIGAIVVPAMPKGCFCNGELSEYKLPHNWKPFKIDYGYYFKKIAK